MFQSKITPPEFSYLAEKLLRGGIAPRQVKRTVAELQDHYMDLYEEAIVHGISEERAAQDALSSLGKEQDLIKEILSQKKLLSWASRYPWTTYGFGPIFLAIVIATAPIGILESLLILSEDMTIYLMPDWMQSSFIQHLTNATFFLASYIMPIIITGYMCFQVSIRRDPLVWPIIGATFMCIFAASYNININWPDLPGYHMYLFGDFNFRTFLMRTVINATLITVFMTFCFKKYRFFKELTDR